MGFKLANIEGRAAWVEGENYYDLEPSSIGKFSTDAANATATATADATSTT